MSDKDKNHIIRSVRQWVETVVIQHNLCPFAKKVHLQNGIRFTVSDAHTEEELLLDLHNELVLISERADIQTTLLIHPDVLEDFFAYNQFLNFADDLLEEMNLIGVYQIASFHPAYQFAETSKGDVENFTNRSPYPVLHILSEEDIEKAIANHPDIDAVPERNKQLMRQLGPDKMKALLQDCFR
jgi:hypothetical protein